MFSLFNLFNLWVYYFRTNIVPRSPTSLKGGESSSGGSQCDPGYDSYSLSSTDSLPLQQTLKHNLQVFFNNLKPIFVCKIIFSVI